MINDLDITKWPDVTFARLSAPVNQMPTIDWNKKVVDMAKLKDRTAKLAGNAFATANTTTMQCGKTVQAYTKNK